MAILVNSKSMNYLMSLVESGDIDYESSWSFSAEDGNDLIEGEFEKYHIAYDTNSETKARFKFPVGKDGEIYRSGVIAAKQRAGGENYQNVLEAADRLLRAIDETTKSNRLKEAFESIKHLVFGKAVDLKVPSYMISNLKRGLELHEAGKSGDGLMPQTVREARQIVESGRISPDKVKRAVAWLARHESDKTPNWDKAGEETPGFVATLLWMDDGSGRAKGWLERKRDELISEGELKQNELVFNRKAFKIYKQVDGQYRWIGVVTNKFEDREKEILTDSAHIEFYNYLADHPEDAPELWIWHTPGTARKNRADWWEYKNGFFVYSGLLTQDEAQPYFELEADEELGMSHGFWVLKRQGKYITQYRTFEVSELPHKLAANPYTNFMIQEEIMNKKFDTMRREFLVSRIGEENVARLEGGLEDAEKILIEAGTDWKELTEQYEAEIEQKEADRLTQITKSVANEVVTLLNIEGLQDALTTLDAKIEKANSQLAKISELEEKVKNLMENEDKRIAKALTPDEPFNWFKVAASKSDETIVENEAVETEVKAINDNSEYSWLKNVTLKEVM